MPERSLTTHDPGQKWAKIRSYDARSEDRSGRLIGKQIIEQQIQEALDYAIFECECYLVWPDEVDLEQFINQYDKTVIQNIRAQFHCKIDYKTRPIKQIQIFAQSELTILGVYSRIFNLVREEKLRQGSFARQNQCWFPSNYSPESSVRMDRDDRTHLFFPSLQDDNLLEFDLDEATQSRIRRQIRENCRDVIESRIRSLHLTQHCVQMHVTYGRFGFRQMQKSSSGNLVYSIEEISKIVNSPRTRLEIQGLHLNCDPTLLVELLASLNIFENYSECYTLNFDFHGRDNFKTIRLEKSYALEKVIGELETRGQQWTELPNIREALLEFNVLDLRRPCFQVQIGAAKVCNTQLTPMQKEFESSIDFVPPPDGIRANPSRRVKYLPGTRELKQVQEVSIARFNVKDSRGVFELRRTDTYAQMPEPMKIPITTWDARFYYPEWENLFGEFAYISPGEDVTWKKSLDTFFPDTLPDSEHGPANGFSKFVQEVEQVQDALQRAIDGLQKS